MPKLKEILVIKLSQEAKEKERNAPYSEITARMAQEAALSDMKGKEREFFNDTKAFMSFYS